MSISLATATVLITGVGRANGIGQATIRALLAAGTLTLQTAVGSPQRRDGATS